MILRIMMSLLPDPTPALPEQRGGSERCLRVDVRGFRCEHIAQKIFVVCASVSSP